MYILLVRMPLPLYIATINRIKLHDKSKWLFFHTNTKQRRKVGMTERGKKICFVCHVRYHVPMHEQGKNSFTATWMPRYTWRQMIPSQCSSLRLVHLLLDLQASLLEWIYITYPFSNHRFWVVSAEVPIANVLNTFSTYSNTSHINVQLSPLFCAHSELHLYPGAAYAFAFFTDGRLQACFKFSSLVFSRFSRDFLSASGPTFLVVFLSFLAGISLFEFIGVVDRFTSSSR